jgi:hypothetical protein
MMIEVGIDSFAATIPDPETRSTLPPADRMEKLMAEVEAAAARTKRIRLTSAVSVLSAVDPVRLSPEFATVDLIAKGRAEMGSGAALSPKPILCSASLCRTMMRCSRKSSICS